MTSVSFLLSCPEDEITLEMVEELVSQNLAESLTLEFKEAFTDRIIKSIAGMANTYGGLILIGVKDQPQPDRLVGVPDSTISKIVSSCRDQLEPPWAPEIIPLALPADPGLYILVLRIYPEKSPRPITRKGEVPIRLHGQNAVADRIRMKQLFSEEPNFLGVQNSYLPYPNPTSDPFQPDLLIRSGLMIPIDQSTAWSPLSEKSVNALADALNRSSLNDCLTKWLIELGLSTSTKFRREGLNRSRLARLSWQGYAPSNIAVRHPVESIFQISSDGTPGMPPKFLQLNLDVILRGTALLSEIHAGRWTVDDVWRIDLPDLYETFDVMVKALIEPTVLESVAEMAGVDVGLISRPMNFHLVTSRGISSLLNPYGLRPIPGSPSAHGANLMSNHSLDISIETHRKKQIDQWLMEIALDGSLEGMEKLLAEYHAANP